MNMPELSWLFINANHLTSLENQLPEIAPNLSIIHASDNRLTRLPQRLRSYTNLETLFVQDNQVIQLDGILSKSRQLKRLVLDKNEISMVRTLFTNLTVSVNKILKLTNVSYAQTSQILCVLN